MSAFPFYYATRKSDGAPCVLFIARDGEQPVIGCARTQREVSVDDFYILGAVPPPACSGLMLGDLREGV